jgi:AAHS family 4-hydroxybenzoate transporter-like MFS transporter
MISETIHVPDIINGKKVGAFQYLIVSLCGLVMFLDGFDTQAISYMAPWIAKEWNLSRELLGLVFSSALTGLMAGYLVLSPLSDRFGHRRMLLVSTGTFGLFTLTALFAAGATEFIALRFLAGLGMGAAIPSAVALTSEYSPQRLRASFVLAIYCGFSLGFVAAGIAAASVLPAYGWRSLLWIGGLAPLVLAVVLFLRLPESLDFLVRVGADRNQILNLLCRIKPRLTKVGDRAAFTTDQENRRGAVRGIFQLGRATGTLLLWFVFIINLAEFYALQSWLPTILTNLHYSISTIALATSLTTTGGIVAAFVVGPAMDRFGSYGSLGIVYLGGVIFVALIGASLTQPEWVLLTTAFFAGFCVSGGQKSVIALAAVFYPAPVRSTGVGWALGIGRIGGILGPWLFGILLGWNLTPSRVLYSASVPMLLAAGAVMLMGRVYRAGATQRSPGCSGGLRSCERIGKT